MLVRVFGKEEQEKYDQGWDCALHDSIHWDSKMNGDKCDGPTALTFAAAFVVISPNVLFKR